jgi:uncharacterized protein (DUF1499 family)
VDRGSDRHPDYGADPVRRIDYLRQFVGFDVTRMYPAGAPPPAFVAIVPLRQGDGINSVAYEGAKISDQQRRAYPDILPLTVGLQPDAAFARALETAQQMGWTIVASDKSAGRVEASQRNRWMGFTGDIVVRVAPTNSGSRIDLRSSSRYGRSDFGVNAERIRDYVTELRSAVTSQG